MWPAARPSGPGCLPRKSTGKAARGRATFSSLEPGSTGPVPPRHMDRDKPREGLASTPWPPCLRPPRDQAGVPVRCVTSRSPEGVTLQRQPCGLTGPAGCADLIPFTDPAPAAGQRCRPVDRGDVALGIRLGQEVEESPAQRVQLGSLMLPTGPGASTPAHSCCRSPGRPCLDE